MRLWYRSAGMITVGCAGFAVPATKYFKEYLFVEVQETHLAVPGPGTLRRWRREAPSGFEFALLGPREVGQEGFRAGKVVETAMKNLDDVATELEAKTVVFVAPPDFPFSRPNRTALKDFLSMVKTRFDRVIFECGWPSDEGDSLAEDTQTLFARDPLHQGVSRLPTAYYRLPGPAGHKSRYEDPAIEKLAEVASTALEQQATYVFTNVDMFADAKRFKRAMGI